jgi:hypothetical protein
MVEPIHSEDYILQSTINTVKTYSTNGLMVAWYAFWAGTSFRFDSASQNAPTNASQSSRHHQGERTFLEYPLFLINHLGK